MTRPSAGEAIVWIFERARREGWDCEAFNAALRADFEDRDLLKENWQTLAGVTYVYGLHDGFIGSLKDQSASLSKEARAFLPQAEKDAHQVIADLALLIDDREKVARR